MVQSNYKSSHMTSIELPLNLSHRPLQNLLPSGLQGISDFQGKQGKGISISLMGKGEY